MTVTEDLSARDRELAHAIGELGFVHPLLTVAAFRKGDVKPQTALACLAKETGSGRNVWGHDAVNTAGCYSKGGVVTETNYRCYKRHRGPASDPRDQQGCGPPQLTSAWLQDKADSRGGCWKPYYSMWTGFEYLGELIRKTGSIVNGAARYNGGDSSLGERNGHTYGVEFERLRTHYANELRERGFRV